MQKKIITVVVLAALGIGGYLGYVQVRFLLFTMRVREVVNDTGRFPDADKIIALKGQLQDAAAHYKLSPLTYGAKIKIEGRDAGPLRFYYLVVKVVDDKRAFEYDEHRVESQTALFEAQEKLNEAGIELKK